LLLKDKAFSTKTDSLLQTVQCTDNNNNKQEVQEFGGIGTVVDSLLLSFTVQIINTETLLSPNHNALCIEDGANSGPTMSYASNTPLMERASTADLSHPNQQRSRSINEKQDTSTYSDIHEHIEAEKTAGYRHRHHRHH
jgi:hypothetical protein